MDTINYTYTYYVPGEVDLDKILQSPLLWDEFEKKTSHISDGLNDMLYSTSTISFMIDLQVKFDLSDEQIANVSRVIRDVMIGRMYMGDMIKELMERVQVDDKIAREIANTIVTGLFAPVMEEIKKIQMENFAARIRGNADPAANVLDLRKNS